MSFSKYNVNCFSDTPYVGLPSPNVPRRQRLNSVFVGSSTTMAVLSTPPRRVKSAIDIQHLIVKERQKRPSIGGFSSMLPILNSSRDRRPSITIERPSLHGRRRPSTGCFDRPMLSHYQQSRTRRTSCFVDRRHKNFISFDQSERKSSTWTDRSGSSSQQPTVSFDTSSMSFEQPKVIVEHAEINHNPARTSPTLAPPKISRSFEQPPKKKEVVPTRFSSSLDVNPTTQADRIPAISETIVDCPLEVDVASPLTSSTDKESSVSEAPGEPYVIISIEDTQISAPYLEGLKSSDVWHNQFCSHYKNVL